MSDYTPTTEDVRREYAIAREGIESSDEVVAQFARWLAGVKAQERQAERKRIIKRLREHEKFVMNIAKTRIYTLNIDAVVALIEEKNSE